MSIRSANLRRSHHVPQHAPHKVPAHKPSRTPARASGTKAAEGYCPTSDEAPVGCGRGTRGPDGVDVSSPEDGFDGSGMRDPDGSGSPPRMQSSGPDSTDGYSGCGDSSDGGRGDPSP